jgi:alpha-tubulin suppressor-like RCC1 family protein
MLWSKVAGSQTASPTPPSPPLVGYKAYFWGSNNYGNAFSVEGPYTQKTAVQIGDDLDWSVVAPSVNAVAAVKTDGSLWTWGKGDLLGANTSGSWNSPVQIGTDYAYVVASNVTMFAVRTNGSLWAWGSGFYGNLGIGINGNNAYRCSPVQVGAATDWVGDKVSPMGETTAAIKSDGTLWVWGRDTTVNVGNGATSVPVQIGTESDRSQISLGITDSANPRYYFAIAVKTNGTLWAWGYNTSGQLGDGTTTIRLSPTQIGTLSDWAQVTAGEECSYAIKANGTLWSWGLGVLLGDGSNNSRSSPVQVGSSSNWVQISSKPNSRSIFDVCLHTLALKADGTVWAWGSNFSCSLGIGTQTSFQSSMVMVDSSANGSVKVAAIGQSETSGPSFSIKADGSLWFWGGGATQLGGTGDSLNGLGSQQVFSPVELDPTEQWDTVALSFASFAGIKDDRSLWVCGGNLFGELGTNDKIPLSSPFQLDFGYNWEKIAAGVGNFAAIKSDGTLWVWGGNSFGQLGNGNILSRSSPIQVGSSNDWAEVGMGNNSVYAIKTNGTLWAWGNNSNGRLGDGTGASRSSPVQIGFATDWVKLGPGATYCFAIKTNGTLWAWGDNIDRQLGDGTLNPRSSPVQIGSASNWAQVSGGIDGSAGIQTDNSLWTWGQGIYGANGQGTISTNTSPVRVGLLNDWLEVRKMGLNVFISNTYAIKTNGTLWAWGQNSDGGLGTGAAGASRSSPVQVGTGTNWKRFFKATPGAVSISTRSYSFTSKIIGALSE